MKNKISLLIIFVLLATIMQSPFSGFGVIQDEELKEKMWRKLLADYPVLKNSVELEYVSSFPSEEDEAKGIYLFRSSYFDLNRKGEIFISNSGANNILKFNAVEEYVLTIGREGQGPTELLSPDKLRIFADYSILVKDPINLRYQVYDFAGKQLYSFKSEKLFRDFAISKDQRIFAKPDLNVPEDNLIDVLDSRGEILYSFGEGKRYDYYWNQLNDASIAINGNELFMVFSHFPILRRYSLDGDLLAENEIINPFYSLQEKENLKFLSRSNKGKVGFLIIIASMRQYNGKIYILSTKPRLEIHEINKDGKIIKTFYKTISRNYYAFDFTLKVDGKNLLFYVLQISPLNRVDVYKAEL